MLFNSLKFAIFFPVVATLYFLNVSFIKRNFVSQLLLLSASLYFYACWNVKYLALILFSVFVTFASGILMEKHPSKKKAVLFLCLSINLLILIFFKYFNFLAGTVDQCAHLFKADFSIPKIDVLLPVGISFYTFQALGYSIDIYRGDLKAEKNILTYTLFVTFFPQLVAGPIERSANLLPQFKSDSCFDYDRVTGGMKLATWGFFKKIVISDYFAVYVNGIYGNIDGATGFSLILATIYFSIQIFCDFSGYSDIAIGISKILGFNLMKNFDKPYFSSSIVEFWRNWHISLSGWFKDYLYIPLGGNRKGTFRRYLNLLITFFVSGIWHGANYTFILWGATHGLYQVVGLSTRKFRNRLMDKIGLMKEDGTPKTFLLLFRILVTYLLVCFAWMFFRADSIADIGRILAKFAGMGSEVTAFFTRAQSSGLKESLRDALLLKHSLSGHAFKQMFVSFLYMGILFSVGIITRKESGLSIIKRKHPVIRWLCYYAAVYTILYSYFSSQTESQFIYFQF